MDLLIDVDAFYLEHRRCRELDVELSANAPAGIVLVCSCGGRLARRIAEKKSLDR